MRRMPVFRQVVAGVLAAAALCACSSGLAGCYRRVVSARGFGADQYQVSEPYQENSRVDDWVFGERASPNQTRLKNMDTPK